MNLDAFKKINPIDHEIQKWRKIRKKSEFSYKWSQFQGTFF